MAKTVTSFDMKGRYGHFCSPFTNVYRLTQPCPTKTAIVGFIGAILGRDRDDLRLYEDIQCGVEISSLYRTKSATFTMRKDFPGKKGNEEHSLTSAELIVDPCYRVYVAGRDSLINELYGLLSAGESRYTPYLGLAQCIASTDFQPTPPAEYRSAGGPHAEVSGAFIRGIHGELDFAALNGDRHRLTEFSGLSGVSQGRRFAHAIFSVNLNPHPVPLRQIGQVIAVGEKHIGVF